jgi:hypothetical protein
MRKAIQRLSRARACLLAPAVATAVLLTPVSARAVPPAPVVVAASSAQCAPGARATSVVRFTKRPGMAPIPPSGSCASVASSGGLPAPALIGLGGLILLLMTALVAYGSMHPPGPRDSESGDDWGTEPPPTPAGPTPPRDGLPLPDAEPAWIRLRGRGRIGRRPVRRRGPVPSREPDHLPARTRN